MWTFDLPTRVTFGVGASGSAVAVASSYGGRPIIVTDATLAEMPRVQGIIEALAGAPVSSPVHPNRTLTVVRPAIRARHRDAEF